MASLCTVEPELTMHLIYTSYDQSFTTAYVYLALCGALINYSPLDRGVHPEYPPPHILRCHH